LIVAPLDAPASILERREALRWRSKAAPAPVVGAPGEFASMERRRTKRNDQENLFVRATVSGHSDFAGLYDRPIVAGRMIKDNINTDWALMIGALVFLFRIIVGLVILAATWFVFDRINDRNTEIIVATIGLLYSFIFIISRRLQHFGLTIFSFFGRTASYIERIPYDHVMRDEVGMRTPGGYTFLNVLFAALIEILCLYRLFSSLLGRGWDTLSEPIRALLHSVNF
jgi:hypothetical protein